MVKIIKKFFNFKKHSTKITYNVKSYSQDGEDVVLSSFLETEIKKGGFYIDIGAHHPFRFSNTQYFYERGWNGINIDATPNSMIEFMISRKRDINIEAAISNKNENVVYYCFKESALNSFDKNLSEKYINSGWELKNKINIKTCTINEILNKLIPVGQKINFINIDIEGIDFEVLKSLDYEKYAPEYFLIEDFSAKTFNEYLTDPTFNFEDYINTPTYMFLKAKNYKLIAKTMRTSIYRKIKDS